MPAAAGVRELASSFSTRWFGVRGSGSCLPTGFLTISSKNLAQCGLDPAIDMPRQLVRKQGLPLTRIWPGPTLSQCSARRKILAHQRGFNVTQVLLTAQGRSLESTRRYNVPNDDAISQTPEALKQAATQRIHSKPKGLGRQSVST